MKVMVFVKANAASEAGELPSSELIEEMMKFNEQLHAAGVMVAGEGLHPSMNGKRVRFTGAGRTVIDGPFSETKELIAGFWIWEVKSMEEAVEWLKRAPFKDGEEVELRRIASSEDYAPAASPEIIARENEMRAEQERRNR
ncbi:MAG: YciI family protein [Chloroflexota bacterium]